MMYFVSKGFITVCIWAKLRSNMNVKIRKDNSGFQIAQVTIVLLFLVSFRLIREIADINLTMPACCDGTYQTEGNPSVGEKLALMRSSEPKASRTNASSTERGTDDFLRARFTPCIFRSLLAFRTSSVMFPLSLSQSFFNPFASHSSLSRLITR